MRKQVDLNPTKFFNSRTLSLSAWAFLFLIPGFVWAQETVPVKEVGPNVAPTAQNTTPVDLPKVKRQKRWKPVPRNDPADIQRNDTIPSDPATVDTPGMPHPAPQK